jgi:hypothetical protein
MLGSWENEELSTWIRPLNALSSAKIFLILEVLLEAAGKDDRLFFDRFLTP